MALPAPDLDDRRFQDIVDEAKRLIPRYCPEWTNHNLSDPGVALIELFAWMSEMILFRLNQVPDRLYTKFLELVGIAPFPPSVAEADLTFWLSTVRPEPVTIPSGTEVGTVGATGGGDVVFSTAADLVIAQPVLEACMTGQAGEEELYADAWDALRYDGGTVTCFTSVPLRPGDTVNFGFDRSLAGNVVRLDVEASIEGIGVDPNDPPVVWEVWEGETWIPVRVHQDTTGGLNRNGAITFLIPTRHEGLTLGARRAHWLRARLLAAGEGQPPYQASPVLRRVAAASLGGTVRAEHARRIEAEVLGRSDGSPGQAFRVQHAPVHTRRAGEHVVVDGVGWQEVPDFSRSGPEDRHVTWDSGSGTITFGPRVRYPDGSVRHHGAIPADGARIGVTGYRLGGGAAGNVGAGTLIGMRTTIPFVDRVTNLAPATGGVDAESIANAKLRGPLSLRTGERAVTASDYERLTREASSEIARARCLPPTEAGGPVRLLVVPHVRSTPIGQRLDDFALDDELVARITEHLDQRRVIGTVVEVGTPYYQGVSVAALLQTMPGRPATLVRERAMQALYAQINPLVGGVEGKGWPFDTDLNVAGLAQTLEAIDGVDRVEEVLLFEYDLRTGTRHGRGREVIRLAPDSLFLSAAHQIVVR